MGNRNFEFWILGHCRKNGLASHVVGGLVKVSAGAIHHKNDLGGEVAVVRPVRRLRLRLQHLRLGQEANQVQIRSLRKDNTYAFQNARWHPSRRIYGRIGTGKPQMCHEGRYGIFMHCSFLHPLPDHVKQATHDRRTLATHTIAGTVYDAARDPKPSLELLWL